MKFVSESWHSFRFFLKESVPDLVFYNCVLLREFVDYLWRYVYGLLLLFA